jgi:hypothetical protein
MRHLIAIVALALSACASVPDRADPNLLAQLQSAENQQRDIAAARQAQAQANAEAIKACATSEQQAACFMGVALVSREGGSGRAEQPVIPTYTPPPSFGSQVRDFLIGLTPIAQAGFSMVAQNHANDVNARTSQVLAGYQRDVAVSHDTAWSGALGAVAQADASRPPSIQIGAGGVYSAGDVTQNAAGRDVVTGTQTVTTTTVGGNQAGRDNIDRHDVVTNCTAGPGGAGGSSGDHGGTGASGAGGAGAAGGAACH